ncbi:hypothetical protein FQN51_001083 [Onygenales sp. PD_10]|nr:hypothetical protein FQN51_001083 [Onygenales sp. PD_10]
MSLSSIPTEILIQILSPGHFSRWPSTKELREDLYNWRLVCKRWDVILERDVVLTAKGIVSLLVGKAPEDKILRELSKIDATHLSKRCSRNKDIHRDIVNYAAKAGFHRVMRELQTAGINLVLDWTGRTLISAAGSGCVDAVRLVIDCNPDVSTLGGFDLKLALRAAATRDHEPTVRLLLEKYGAEIDVQKLQDVLRNAAKGKGSPRLMQFILDELSRRQHVFTADELAQLLRWVSRRGDEDAVQFVIDKWLYIERELISEAPIPDQKDVVNWSVLITAARLGKFDIVSRLLRDPRTEPLRKNDGGSGNNTSFGCGNWTRVDSTGVSTKNGLVLGMNETRNTLLRHREETRSTEGTPRALSPGMHSAATLPIDHGAGVHYENARREDA